MTEPEIPTPPVDPPMQPNGLAVQQPTTFTIPSAQTVVPDSPAPTAPYVPPGLISAPPITQPPAVATVAHSVTIDAEDLASMIDLKEAKVDRAEADFASAETAVDAAQDRLDEAQATLEAEVRGLEALKVLQTQVAGGSVSLSFNS